MSNTRNRLPPNLAKSSGGSSVRGSARDSRSAPEQNPGFSQKLKEWRAHRRVSQLDLALESGISQRHISYLESGRSTPSRPMVLRLARALSLPLRAQNSWLLAAGFAPVFQERQVSAPDMAPVRDALDRLLKHHSPYPALVVDKHWNLLQTNAAIDALFGLIPDVDQRWQDTCPNGQRNLLRFTLHPRGLREFTQNWEESAPQFVQRVLLDADSDPALRLQMETMLNDCGVAYQAAYEAPIDAATMPMIPFTLATGGMQVSLFSLITTFGTPHDVTTDELRIELFYPIDDQTRLLLEAIGAQPGA